MSKSTTRCTKILMSVMQKALGGALVASKSEKTFPPSITAGVGVK